MKKRFLIFILSVMMLMMSFTACGEKKESSESTEKTATETPKASESTEESGTKEKLPIYTIMYDDALIGINVAEENEKEWFKNKVKDVGVLVYARITPLGDKNYIIIDDKDNDITSKEDTEDGKVKVTFGGGTFEQNSGRSIICDKLEIGLTPTVTENSLFIELNY